MKISFWSDYACPFCWIGEARLRKALIDLGLLEQATLIPRAFELNPDAPDKTDLNGLQTISRRYGMTPEQTRAEFEKIAAMGRKDGLELRQVDTRHTSTFNSHRLMKLALAAGDRDTAEKVNELLFAAFFVENANLADPQVLLETGIKGGLREAQILEMLESDKFAAEVREDEREAARMGVHAVPFFVFENGATLSGAAEVADFRKILANASSKAAGQACGPNGCRLD